MSGVIAGLFLNVVIVVLLALTIAYCWILNRRIKVLQDSKSELAQLLNHFDESTRRASESIIALQTASKKIGENIQFRIDKANFLLDDLTFMIERGNKLANQLEAGVAVNKARSRAIAEVDEEKTIIAEELPARPSAKPVIEKPVTSRERTAASLEAVLERVMGRGKSDDDHDRPPPPSKARSKAEKELLELIKSGGLKG